MLQRACCLLQGRSAPLPACAAPCSCHHEACSARSAWPHPGKARAGATSRSGVCLGVTLPSEPAHGRLARVQGVHCSFFHHPPPSLPRTPRRWDLFPECAASARRALGGRRDQAANLQHYQRRWPRPSIGSRGSPALIGISGPSIHSWQMGLTPRARSVSDARRRSAKRPGVGRPIP